ncbi:MAG TPA: acetolactate synthase large subunit [Gammaproteobacteria bacterium]|nr:acetolactate synthase large subunit [Gammaproteobacteria bacterium]
MSLIKAAELFVRCLEHEGVEYVFGVPGEENLDVMDALLDSRIQFITTRHEQGAAFMADVYGRLTGKPGVCLATLGPGATNLITGVADANMDNAPLVAIAGQADTDRLHKESHQVLKLDEMFQHITKYSTRILNPNVINEVVRKAFKLALTEKKGATFIEFPENIAKLPVDAAPLPIKHPHLSEPASEQVTAAAALIAQAKMPIILAGNGVIRSSACEALVAFAEQLNIPVANTFMAKGVMPFRHSLALGSVGLQAKDYTNVGFAKADVIICVGYDLVEYHPKLWNVDKTSAVIHIDMVSAEVDAHYPVTIGVIGNIKHALLRIAKQSTAHQGYMMRPLRDALINDMKAHSHDSVFPPKPQKIIWDLRTALASDDVVITDVGAHKMWMARMYRCDKPNTCIISNGFASMGIAVPGALAAKLVYPKKAVVAVTGDGGFLMNSQEIETAVRLKLAMVILIWNDSGYGLIEWKQMNQFNRPSNVAFGNPDFIQYAESFGAKGYRIEKTEELLPVIKKALADDTVSIIDCPVDYSENLKLTEQLGDMVCPI